MAKVTSQLIYCLELIQSTLRSEVAKLNCINHNYEVTNQGRTRIQNEINLIANH